MCQGRREKVELRLVGIPTMHDEDRLMELLSSWEEAIAHGRNPSAAGLCGDRADLIEPLEERIALLERFQKREVTSPPAAQSDHKDPDETRSYDSSPTPTAPPETSPPTVGDTFAGFKLLSVLGEGGSGTVFRAEDKELRRKVALKVLHARALARPGAQESFLAEARALAAVQHDHVVPIFQVGRENGQLFLAMPFLGGETLAARIEREGALPPNELRRIGREMASGLAAIHAKGLVHRDLKPMNIWLEAGNGRVKVLDLGLAQDSLATSDSIAGTAAYMSPEQAEGKDLDFRSDLFSLGTVLYECASGRRPFGGDSMIETLRSICEETPPSVARANPGVPTEVSSLIKRLHQKNPSSRPASASMVAEGLAVPTLLKDERAKSLASRWRCWPIRIKIAIPLGTLLIVGVAAINYANSNRKTEPQPSIPAAVEPLRILEFNVHHFARVENGAKVENRGIFGKSTFAAVQRDQVTLDLKLSQPAYAYLLAFRPDGAVELCYPESEEESPPKSDRPRYPSRSETRNVRYGLSEAAGLWVFSAIVSDEPLPPYKEWVGGHPLPSLKNPVGVSGIVLLDDGEEIRSLHSNGWSHGTRGKGELAIGQTNFEAVTNALKAAAPKGIVRSLGVFAEPAK